MIEIPNYDKRKVFEIYRALMNVLERNNAATAEGFCALMAGLKTIVENPGIPAEARADLKRRVIQEMERQPETPGGLLVPGLMN